MWQQTEDEDILLVLLLKLLVCLKFIRMPVKSSSEPCWECLQEALRNAMALRVVATLPTDSKRTASRSNQFNAQLGELVHNSDPRCMYVRGCREMTKHVRGILCRTGS